MNTISFLSSTITPSKIVCIGRNYVAHIQELNNEIPGEPVIFLKPNSAITTALATHTSEPIHYESEISFVIKNGSLAGVGFGLDLTKRQLQQQLKHNGLPWERAKAFDGSAVFSDFVAFTGSLEALRLVLSINNQIAQEGGCSSMIHQPDALLAHVATFMSFEDGDLLMTGTPKGVGEIRRGDHFTGQIFADEHLLVEKEWIVA